MKYLLLILVMVVGLALSGFLGWKLPEPFVLVFLIYAFLCGYVFFFFKRKVIRLLAINLCLIFLLLTVAEFVARLRINRAQQAAQTSSEDTSTTADSHEDKFGAYFEPDCSYRKDYYESSVDPVLGYKVCPGITANSIKKLTNGEILYDVTYTIGDNGLRFTPQKFSLEKLTGSILFFGGSFMFGEGLEDNQTIPAQVAAGLSQRNMDYQVVNFGLHGYGAHQMLSLLESDYVDKAITATPRRVIYLFIKDHIKRTSGDTTWDFTGPRYVLTGPQKVSRRGNFYSSNPFNFLFWSDSLAARFLEKAKRHLLIKSAIWVLVDSVLHGNDLELFEGVLLAARAEVSTKYPGCGFSVIVWDNSPELAEFLVSNDFNWYARSEIIPDFATNSSRYVLRADNHPNALADSIIANFIVNNIIISGSAAGTSGENK